MGAACLQVSGGCLRWRGHGQRPQWDESSGGERRTDLLNAFHAEVPSCFPVPRQQAVSLTACPEACATRIVAPKLFGAPDQAGKQLRF